MCACKLVTVKVSVRPSVREREGKRGREREREREREKEGERGDIHVQTSNQNVRGTLWSSLTNLFPLGSFRVNQQKNSWKSLHDASDHQFLFHLNPVKRHHPPEWQLIILNDGWRQPRFIWADIILSKEEHATIYQKLVNSLKARQGNIRNISARINRINRLGNCLVPQRLKIKIWRVHPRLNDKYPSRLQSLKNLGQFRQWTAYSLGNVKLSIA